MMFRASANSVLIKSVSVLVTLLAIVPAGLHAEPTGKNRDLQPQIAPKAAQLSPSSTETPVKKAPLNGVKQEGTQPTPSRSPISNPAPKPKPTETKAEPPVTEVISLVLNLNKKRVYVYKGDEILTSYPVAIGKKNWETPVGEWQVMEKIKNPGWTSFKNRRIVLEPGRDNPLGARWIGFWTDGRDVIGFHGTPNVKSVGTAASHGCVRMYNRDVKALYRLVKVGTTVKVVER
jgi:lipoprotein-anchoring transpeptidase ErfK/SrfK